MTCRRRGSGAKPFLCPKGTFTSEAMPITKHRRKGKTRPRGNLKTLVFPPLTLEENPEVLEEDRLIQERLRMLHGEREWSADEWEEATEQLIAEGAIRPYDEPERVRSV